jgi:two-component system nitrogen regulation sensor histidine kinase NtrY
MKRNKLLQRIYWSSGLLGLFVIAFLTSVIFLNPSSVGNQNFLWFLNLWALVWALIFILILTIAFILARNLILLFFEYQARHPGSRIKSKLVSTFILFSLFPALIMFFVAFGLINENLTKWVRAPSDQLVESSEMIAREFYKELRTTSIAAAKEVAERADLKEGLGAQQFSSLPGRSRFKGILLLDRFGRSVFQEGEVVASNIDAANVERVLTGETFYELERGIDTSEGVVDKGIVGTPVITAAGETEGALFGHFDVPHSVAFQTQRVREASDVYKGLKGTLASLRVPYFSILALTTLTVVFGFVWLGNYIAKKLTVPLEALAEGSRELAGGNLDHRVEVSAVDELGILVSSFNRMAEQLKESRSQLEKANLRLKSTNVRLDERRRYIETILQNIATGVLTVDESEVIRTVNEAALKMFQTSREEIINRGIGRVTDPELYGEFREMRKRARLYGTYRKQITFKRNDRRLYVAATITVNPAPLQDEVEYLIVLDDLTELIRAEKFAAWQEVAQRLAHEIKNPLTPIQLSAERIRRRYEKLAGLLPKSAQLAEFGQVLVDASRIIVTESLILKNLLAEFSRFARLPMCKPTMVHLHELIDETLALYDGRLDAVRLVKDFDHRIDRVSVDPEQMQRVFVNLIDNSMDALVEVSGDRSIQIKTAYNESRGSVRIELGDTGMGISAGDYERLFLPHFSTKKKGSGLGLAIVRQIVSEHNGFIRAEPNEPRGTKFIVEIPVA